GRTAPARSVRCETNGAAEHRGLTGQRVGFGGHQPDHIRARRASSVRSTVQAAIRSSRDGGVSVGGDDGHNHRSDDGCKEKAGSSGGGYPRMGSMHRPRHKIQRAFSSWRVIAFDDNIAYRAAWLGATLRFKLPDAVQAASALS